MHLIAVKTVLRGKADYRINPNMLFLKISKIFDLNRVSKGEKTPLRKALRLQVLQKFGPGSPFKFDKIYG
jgi:hypothetical protein